MKILEAMAAIEVEWAPPGSGEETPLFESGLLCVLARSLTEPQTIRTLRALKREYEDWNELRVSQVQEYEALVASKSAEVRLSAVRAVKVYIQEIFQKNHGFDLEHLREDPTEAAKFLCQIESLGAAAAHHLLWLMGEGTVPVSTGVIRVLDRTASMKRTSSIRKAQATLEPIVAPERRAEFGLRFGTVVEYWCDVKKPTCWECPLLKGCPFGKRVHREWQAQQKRLAAQRKKEEERRRRDEERQRKRAEAQARKRAQELARQRTREEKRKKQEAERRAREFAKRREAERKATAKKKAKKTTAKAKKKPAAKKPAAKKPATKKPATKKPATKKPATKKPAAKKPATKRPATKKPGGKSGR